MSLSVLVVHVHCLEVTTPFAVYTYILLRY